MRRRIAVTVAAIAICVVAATKSIRVGYADLLFSRGDRYSVAAAVQLDPARALYRVGLGDLVDRAGGDSRPALREAAALKPDDADIMIRLGLREEAHGQVEEAERRLLSAVRVSRKYDGPWALANFYYRRGEVERFWRWAREGLAVSYGDRTSMFRLCWSVAPDPEVVRERAIPERREVQLAWMRFLLRQQRHDAAGAVATTLVRGAMGGEVNRFVAATDAFLRAGRVATALAVWNTLSESALIRRNRLETTAGDVVSNGDFNARSFEKAFDWRAPRTDAVFVTQAPGAWTVSLTGRQPERCTILNQTVPVVGGRTYRFGCRYRATRGGPKQQASRSGLRWRVQERNGKLLAESVPLAMDGPGEAGFEFAPPEGLEAVHLFLVYERASGAVRTEGTLILEQVSIRAVEHGQATSVTM